jgi:hypothetical protein
MPRFCSGLLRAMLANNETGYGSESFKSLKAELVWRRDWVTRRELMMLAQGKWRKLDGQNRLPDIIQGVEFRDGLRQLQAAD